MKVNPLCLMCTDWFPMMKFNTSSNVYQVLSTIKIDSPFNNLGIYRRVISDWLCSWWPKLRYWFRSNHLSSSRLYYTKQWWDTIQLEKGNMRFGCWYIAQFQITDFFRFGSVWSRFYQLFGLRVFCCKKLRIKSLGFCQTDNPRFMHCYSYPRLIVETWKWVNLVPYVSQQRGSPWLSALEIFHNISCLLEFQGVWYLDTYAFSSGVGTLYWRSPWQKATLS